MIKLKDILNEWGIVDPGPKRWFKPYSQKGTDYERATIKEYGSDEPSDKFRDTLDYDDEDGNYDDPLTKERIEADMKIITRQNVRVKQKGNVGEWKVEWKYMRRELPSDKWNKALKHITDVYGANIDKEWTRNDYEENYEPEEPAEWIPSIYFEEA